MAVNVNLDKLVSDLSNDERQNLLGKLKGQSSLSNEPLYAFTGSSEPISGHSEVRYAKLPWYSRFWYSILGYFKGKTPEKIFGDDQVTRLGIEISKHSQGLYDYHSNMLLPGFYRQLVKLKEAAKFFYTALDVGVNRDRGAFFAFLGSIEMQDVHARLHTETDPKWIEDTFPGVLGQDLRQKAIKAMDDAYIMVTEEYRNIMYLNARSLNCLKGLSSYLYDRFLLAFSVNNNYGGEVCSASSVRELLMNLSNILFSLKNVPSMSLMESLFVFILQEKAVDPNFDVNRETRVLMAKAEESLSVIRGFNSYVPLNWIIRCSTRDMTIRPQELSGGEDWFVVYKDFWKRRMDSLFADYEKNRRQRELLESFKFFFKGKSLKVLENARSEQYPDGLPIKGAFALSFLHTFYSVIFMPEMNGVLRPILIDGEFANTENRQEFTEDYNSLIKIEDDIRFLETTMAPDRDFGRSYHLARQEMSPLPVKRRKIQLVLDEAQDEAAKIITSTKEASISMLNILSGFLGKDTRGKYFPLKNFSKFSGRDNKLIGRMSEMLQQFHTLLRLLDDIDSMESGK